MFSYITFFDPVSIFLCPQMKKVLDKASAELVGKPLFVGVLSDKQWHQLSELQKELQDEYCMRQEMLIKRLDVTIQSFQASNKRPHSVVFFSRVQENIGLFASGSCATDLAVLPIFHCF